MDMVKKAQLIAFGAPVAITAGEKEGEKEGPPKFEAEFYTGGQMEIEGWDLPVVIDLAGIDRGNVLVANLDHDRTKRVGNFVLDNDGKRLIARGTASAATDAKREVVESAESGYQWQASLEVNPKKIEQVAKGKTVEVNGQSFTGPIYVTRKGTLKGFAFVSHGADDNTQVTIAATAAKESEMKAEVKAWAEGMGIDVDNASPELIATIEANYEGKNGKKLGKVEASNPFEARKQEAKRRDDIKSIADKFIERRDGDLEYIEAIEKMCDHAIEAGMSAQEFRSEMYESMVPLSHTVPKPSNRDRGLNDRILQAAVCSVGRLANLEKEFTDQELQAAHTRFPNGISLSQLFILAAEANGYRGTSGGQVTLEVQRAAFGINPDGKRLYASQGFSTIDIASVVAATANKFLHEGWMFVDQTPLRISRIKNVRNFHQHTTVSLTGALQFEALGPDGEIKHGAIGDLEYTNQADTYAAMLAITRKDIINDDLGALTAVPRRLGRGGALKLNDLFWTAYLAGVSTSFFASGNANINTGVATMTIAGLDATETIFMNQTDPDGKPVGFTPRILLVPSALKNAALAIANPNSLLITGATSVTQANTNVFAGRFRVESSPYISNASYTGNTAVGWWMLADPMDEAVVEIAALNGRVEPIVDTADAAFNALGVQMRGYCDIGVAMQEYRAGVYADGGAS